MKSTDLEKSSKLQKDLTELRTITFKFKDGYKQFQLQKQTPMIYLGLYATTENCLVALSLLYLVGHEFNVDTNLLTRKKKRVGNN